MECFNDSVVQLKERFTPRADNKSPAIGMAIWPVVFNRICKVFCGFELPAAWAINTNEVCIAKLTYGA